MSEVIEFGFITVSHYESQGLVGGLLVLNKLGRPCEFHCTVPVRASRAQEVLYGNTLAPFLCGEQIAQTLLAKARASRQLEYVFTDTAAVLAAAPLVDVVLVYVPDGARAAAAPVATTVQPVEEVQKSLVSFGLQRVETSDDSCVNESVVVDVAGVAPEHWKSVMIGRRSASIAADSLEEANAIAEQIATVTALVDLAEPFTRLRLAIDETQKEAA
ncbi:MAG: hypothetical protein ACRC46_12095 [Thermoguttaceae bacterium]